MEKDRVEILGVLINAVNLSQTVDQIGAWIEERGVHYLCACPAHSIMECVKNPQLYPLYNNCSMTFPDGMSVVWLLKWQGFKHVERVAATEMMEELFSLSAQRGWRHYFYGGSPETLVALVQKIETEYSGLQIAGKYSPPFRDLSKAEENEVVARINASSADIVWVGIGSPRQEQWMGRQIGRIEAPVMIGVGAAFDFLSGQKPRAPRWMQRSGLEWLFRLFNEPVRLWPRYRQYPKFVFLALAQLLGLWHPKT